MGADPRSPTNDFIRTPIVINVGENEMPTKIKNKNLEKVLRSEICTPKNSEKSNIIPPKFLGSSPIKQRSDAYKRKSFVGLLETNIDFTETDLDAVIQNKTKTKEIPVQNRIYVVENENVDPRSPTSDFIRTPIQIVKKIGEIEVNDPETDSIFEYDTINMGDTKDNIVENSKSCDLNEKIMDVVATEEYTNSIHEMIVTNENLQIKQLAENQVPDEVNIIEGLDVISETVPQDRLASETVSQSKSAPVSPSNTKPSNISLNGSRSTPSTPPLVNLTADIKELDKKLTNLIYEDQDIIVCPRIVQLKDVLDRSPLRSRNVIETDKKSAQKLRVSDKPRKSEGGVKSRIPVYREKVKKGKIQCENTPPRYLDRKKQVKNTHWDSTNTTLYL